MKPGRSGQHTPGRLGILFICHGNICRSPMAEYVLRHLAEAAGLERRLHIASAATSAEESGSRVYPPVSALLRREGIDCSDKRAVQVSASEMLAADHVIIMDTENLSVLRRRFPDECRKRPPRRLLAYAGRDEDVADPWYTRDFEQCYRDILQGCTALLTQLRAELEPGA